jgi:adenylate cyclase
LDYTAHGDVMNTAARLEAANKTFGTSVLIGPVAAARLGTEGLRPLGLLEVRGRSGALAVYTVE